MSSVCGCVVLFTVTVLQKEKDAKHKEEVGSLAAEKQRLEESVQGLTAVC